MTALNVAFDARLPHARWGPLFHVFRLERPNVGLDWRPVGFPMPGCPLLDGADVGLFLQPPHEDDLCALTLDASPMVVVMAVGHRLSHHDGLEVADVLDEPFPGGPNLHPEWSAFWRWTSNAARRRSKPTMTCAAPSRVWRSSPPAGPSSPCPTGWQPAWRIRAWSRSHSATDRECRLA
jgi:hypothetical protein